MAVYVIPRNRNNIWWGGGRGGGILDLIGQTLIQPMIMRDAMARQYKYQLRLDDAEREYNEANRQKFAAGVRQTPGFVSGSDLMYAYGPSIGYNGNVADITAALMPRQLDTNTGDTIVSRTLLPDGSESTRTTFNIGMSPQEAGALALSTRAAELEEWKARQAVALEREKARRGTGPALVPLQGYTNDEGNPLLYNQYTGQTVPLYGAKPVRQQPNMAQAALTASEIVKNIFPSGGMDGNFGMQTGGEGTAGGDRVSVFRELLNAFGDGSAPAPVFPGYSSAFDDPAAFGRALSDMNAGGGGGVFTPQPAATRQQSAGAPSFRERLRDWRTGDAPVAVPGTPQASAKKPFVSAAAVANYAKQFGISEEAARDELTRFNSM